MSAQPHQKLSIIAPVYNESANIRWFHNELSKELHRLDTFVFEIIYVDDGSHDASLQELQNIAESDARVTVIALTRNFGKEVASTAGIQAASGEALILLDSDGQHPPELIASFIEKWESGAKVVIGLRTANHKEGFVKRLGSKVFYKLFGRMTGVTLKPGTTDFRLIDNVVQEDFKRMTEHSRITRGLIDWLGYRQANIEFEAPARRGGQAGYSLRKLIKLAVDSIVSMSLSPLFVTAYVGAIILPLAALTGLSMIVDALLGDPLRLDAKGSAYVIVLILFLIGVLMTSQGIIGLYLSHIHTETQNRPLYVVDAAQSRNVQGQNER